MTETGESHLGLFVASILAGSLCAGCSTPTPGANLAYFPPPPAQPRVAHLKSFNNLYDLVRPRITFRDRLRGGPISPYVQRPAGVAVWGDHLYICDAALGVVHEWNLTTGEARRIGGATGGGSEGEARLSKPVDVALGADGTLYVADTQRGRVIVYDSSGAARRTMRPHGVDDYRPVSVALDGSMLYVADIVGHRIDGFSTESGEYLGSVGGVGSEPGRFYFPMGVAVDDAGRVYVSDMMNARAVVLDADDRTVRSMGRPGNRYGDMGKPRHLAVGPDGVIFVADAEFQRVHLFDGDGRLLMLLGAPEEETGELPLPTGVAPDLRRLADVG
ncbi:MAG: hypothetical protein ACE5EX_11270, partial [Phycisphaerae bacterium]